MEQPRKNKVKAIINDVLLNEEAQKEWNDNVDHDFLAAIEVFGKRYDQELPMLQWLRTGVMLGAVYEIWKQKQNEGTSSALKE